MRSASSVTASLPTPYTFTGQFSYMDDPTTGTTEGFGLLFYNARWYDPLLGRFAQADTIIPGGVQGYDRYAYVSNNPIKLTDPSGHKCVGESEECLDDDRKPINGAANQPANPLRRRSAPRSTLIHDFQLFSEIQWFTLVDALDSSQMQQYCNRNYGADVECGRFLSRFGNPLTVNILIDAMGIRIEGSGWLFGGADLNIDILYFGRSSQTGVFVSPGGQSGTGGGGSITGGILIGQNMRSQESYSGLSYTVAGTNLPTPLGVNVEIEQSVGLPNANGTIPQTTYIGGGPLQPEGGIYSGANFSFSITGLWNWITGE